MRFKPGLTLLPEQIAVVDDEGRAARGVNWLLTEEEQSQVAAGYRCLHCMEPFANAFPENCGVCGFPVRAEQALELQRGHQGTKDLGLSPAMRQVEEERERENWRPVSGIWVPGDPL